MRRIRIPGTDVLASRLSFGTASLHHLPRAADRRAHLEAALDLGFTHFDTAPLYGFGEAERSLGEAFGSDGRVTITTKVGLYPPGGPEQSHHVVLARKIAGRLVPSLSRARADHSVDQARRSLDGSLRRLKRDHVAFLLLHEPDHALLATDEWERFIEDQKSRFVAFGVAGPRQSVEPFAAITNPMGAVVQTRDGLVSREADFLAALRRPMQFTYGYFSEREAGTSSDTILRDALARNRTGSIVVATRDRSRLAALAAAAVLDTHEDRPPC